MNYLLYNLITYMCYKEGIQALFSILPSRYRYLSYPAYIHIKDN